MFLTQKDLLKILVPLPPSCVALKKLSNLSDPPFPYLCNGGDDTQCLEYHEYQRSQCRESVCCPAWVLRKAGPPCFSLLERSLWFWWLGQMGPEWSVCKGLAGQEVV